MLERLYDPDGRSYKARKILVDWRCMREPWRNRPRLFAVMAALITDPLSVRFIVGFLFNKEVVREDIPNSEPETE